MKDQYFAILRKLATSLGHRKNSLDYQELEDELLEDPSAVAKKYVHLLDRNEQLLLGYAKEADPFQKDYGIEELRRDWPPPQPRPRIWNRDLLARASGNRRAWILGWNKYKHLQSLESPEKDVAAVAELLSDTGLGHFRTTPTDDRDAGTIEKSLTDAIAAATEDDTLLVYYSGHGFSPAKGDTLYLAAPETDFRQPASAISVDAISEAYARSRCRSLLLVLDCCQSGGVTLDVSRLGKKRYRPRKGEYHDAFGFSGLRVLASSTRGQDSYEEVDSNTGLSVFTGDLLHGLRSGRADADDDGAVTDAEAFAYVRNRLARQRLLERQSPIHHVVEGESPFLLALNERTIETPALYQIPAGRVEMHLAIQAMAALVRESAPILFSVSCSKYYFREVNTVALASGLAVSPIHTPFLRASQLGFVCETFFPPYLVPEDLLEKRRPVNGLVSCFLEVRFEDVFFIIGSDFTNGQEWNVYVPPGTVVTGGALS